MKQIRIVVPAVGGGLVELVDEEDGIADEASEQRFGDKADGRLFPRPVRAREGVGERDARHGRLDERKVERLGETLEIPRLANAGRADQEERRQEEWRGACLR